MKVFWVEGRWPGRLGIVPRPRGGDWLEVDARAWREAAIDMVVSLLEADEEAQLDLQGESGAVAASGIDYRSFPIPDRGIPASRDDVATLARQIVEALEAGRNVAVHCRQSIGRSGLIAASVLLLSGRDLDAALAAISEARGLRVPETEGQHRWLTEFDRSE